MKAENKRIVASVSLKPVLFQKLKECKENNGISRSWLINKLLIDYFENIGGKKNGEQ